MFAARRDLIQTAARLEARRGEGHGISPLSQLSISAALADGSRGRWC